MKYYIKLLAMPLFFGILFGSLFVIWKVFNLPSNEELIKIATVWFDRYGLPIVFLSSIVEGVLLVGNYFPGVFVIFLGVILASTISQAMKVVIAATLGLFISHIFNYALGKYGWYKLLVKFGMKGAVEQARKRLVKRGPIAIISSYWLPNLGALTDTAAGIMHMPFRIFIKYSVISTIMWNAIAGTLVYSFKGAALSIATPTSGSKAMFVIIAIWIIVSLAIDFYNKRKEFYKSEGILK